MKKTFLTLIALLLVICTLAFCLASCNDVTVIDLNNGESDEEDEESKGTAENGETKATKDTDEENKDTSNSESNTNTDTNTDSNTDTNDKPVYDPNATKNDYVHVQNAEQVYIPNLYELSVITGTDEAYLDLYNPVENTDKCFFEFEVYLNGAGGAQELLYKSNVIPANAHIKKISLSQTLNSGEYNVTVRIQPYEVVTLEKMGEISIDTKLLVYDFTLVTPPESSDKGIAIPGWGNLTIPPNQTENIIVDFYNPEVNKDLYYLTYELYISNSDGSKDILYKSQMVEPGAHISKITLTHGLEAGEYEAMIHVQPYKMDELTATNNMDSKLTLKVVGNGSSSNNFVPITEDVEAYMLMSVNVRINYKKSSTNGAALYGSKVTRIEKNDTWTKIAYTDVGGAAKEGYVYNEVLTLDVGRVTYVAYELPLKATANTSNVSVRSVPWIGKNDEGTVLHNTLIYQIMGADGENYKLKKDQEVEILGTTQTADDSGNKWAYIKYTVGEETVYGWCRMDFVNAGEPNDEYLGYLPSIPSIPTPVA